LVGRIPDRVVLCNARGVHDAATAELAVGLAIAALRGIPEFVRAKDQGQWRHERRRSLADCRVMILGLGSVGRAVHERLLGFEVEICAVARSARTDPDGTSVHSVDELPMLLPTVDVVIVTLPLDRTTAGLVDATFLASMRDGALLVNVARGAVVDTDALLAELASGRLAAAVDVTEPEPLPPGHALWRAPNLLITPHVGGDSSAYLPRAARLICEQLTRYAAGEPLVNRVGRDSEGLETSA
jgi:phosphoglycerate dehydrogenase-like enzyme